MVENVDSNLIAIINNALMRTFVSQVLSVFWIITLERVPEVDSHMANSNLEEAPLVLTNSGNR